MSSARHLRSTLVRTVSSVRRNGWNEATVAEALRALHAMLPQQTDASSRRETLARELVRSLIAQPMVLHGLGRERDRPPVPDHLEQVAEILAGPQETWLSRLGDAYTDPTAGLIDLVNDIDACEREGGNVPEPHASAILVLGELGSRDGVRTLFECIDWHSEDVHQVVRGALTVTARLADHAVALWQNMNRYARWMVVEELARRELRDDRIFALLVDWLDSGDDLEEAVCALGSSADPRCVPHLLSAIDRLLDRGQPYIATEVMAFLEDYDAAPTSAQRERHAQMLAGLELN